MILNHISFISKYSPLMETCFSTLEMQLFKAETVGTNCSRCKIAFKLKGSSNFGLTDTSCYNLPYSGF